MTRPASRLACLVLGVLAAFALHAAAFATPALAAFGWGTRTSRADVLVYRDTTPPSGRIRTAVISAEPSRSGRLEVGFFELRLGSAGDQWRSAAWSAIATSSLLLGRDVNESRFAFEYNGAIDGPSAGALFTVHILALALGDRVRADTTMTGTINPDGTVGPVGGVAAKLRGASEAGKRRIAIPAGSLTREVDAVRQETGLEVVEAANIFEAYRFLTGRALPLPASDDRRPQLSSEFFAAASERTAALQAVYREREPLRTPRGDLPEDSPQAIARRSLASSREEFRAAEAALRAGDLASAYEQTLRANWLMTAAGNISALTELDTAVRAATDAAEEDLSRDRLVQLAEDNWSVVEARGRELFAELEQVEARTAADAVTLVRAYGYWLAARGFQQLARGSLADLARTSILPKRQRNQALFYAAIAPALAESRLQAAADAIALGMGGPGVALQPERVRGFSNLLYQAANASLLAFESLAIAPRAESAAVAVDVIREQFDSADASYFLARSAFAAIPELASELASDRNRPYLRLGGSLLAYIHANSLIAKYYSLKADFDPDLETIGFRVPAAFANERGLSSMLDFADRQARQQIEIARATGSEPSLQILDYNRARNLREGDAARQMLALLAFWEARAEANLMAIFSGKFAVGEVTWLDRLLQVAAVLGAIALVGLFVRYLRRKPAHS